MYVCRPKHRVMSKPWFRLVKRFAEFSASSLIGTTVDTVVLWVFSKWVFSSYVGEYIVKPAKPLFRDCRES